MPLSKNNLHIPYSRKNWRQMKAKINTFFNEFESNYILLHKPIPVKVLIK